MPTSNSATAIERALRYWEDAQFMRHMLQEEGVHPSANSSADFENAREYLLRYRPGTPLEERFLRDDLANSRNTPGIFYGVMQWIGNSRRIYRLSKEMQEAFSEIDPGNVRISDLVVPFPAFAIELAAPIKGSHLIMVGRMNEWASFRFSDQRFLGMTSIYALQTTLGIFGSCPTLDPRDKQEVLNLLRSGNRKAAFRKFHRLPLNRAHEWWSKMPEDHFGTDIIRMADVGSDLTASEVMTAYSKTSYSLVSAMRILLNLLVYLDALPDKVRETEGKVWNKEKQDTGPLKGVITDTMRVCEIGSRHILDSMIKDERTPAERTGGHLVTPHWRRAHKRRAPGQGNNPLAEKTVRVRHTLVLGSKMPERGVPVGSMGVVKR